MHVQPKYVYLELLLIPCLAQQKKLMMKRKMNYAENFCWEPTSLTKEVTIVCDPLLSEYGPTRPPVLISKALRNQGFEVNVVSVIASEKVRKNLESCGIRVDQVSKTAPVKSESLAWFYFWLLEGFLSANSRKVRRLSSESGKTVLNFSNTIVSQSRIWYAQGPPTVLLDNIRGYLPPHFRTVYLFSSQVLRKVDRKMTQRFSMLSSKVVANSRYLAAIYGRWNVKVAAVIYPPIECQVFKPTTNRPSGDYAVTYFGKETDFRVVQQALDRGIRVKAFGGKFSAMPKRTLTHPNLEFMGRISDHKLIEVYSNAMFTLFPFIDEPFGYIPLESMACGTPVATFGSQGPRETVIDKATGWLARDEKGLVDIACRVWKEGYPPEIRRNCRRRSFAFDINPIARQWMRAMVSSRSI
jgi:glycosyltransferase involved in cell wall biosynthesis